MEGRRGMGRTRRGPVNQPLLPELLKLLHEHGSFGLNYGGQDEGDDCASTGSDP